MCLNASSRRSFTIVALSFFSMDSKRAIVKLLKIILSLLIGAGCVMVMLFKTLFKGPKMWVCKERRMPTDVMNHEYGIHRYVQLKDIKLHYVECRSRGKPLMLFLHGFPEFWYSWRHQIKAFKNDYWTVAVDMRGYGESDRPSGVKAYDKDFLVEDVKNLVHYLGHRSCVLVAHDWGGLVAFLLVNRHPELVDKIILINTAHPSAFYAHITSSCKQMLKSWYMLLFQLPLIPEFLLCSDDLKVFDNLYKIGTKENGGSITAEDIEAFKCNLSTRDKWTAPINYYRRLDLDDEEIREMKLKKVEVPGLIIWGRRDVALGTKLAQLTADCFRNCKVKYVRDAGHFVHQSFPSEVNKHMAAFLK